MHRQPRRKRPEERAEPTIGCYHELFFESVAEGVAYCQGIVPHVVPPCGTVTEGQPSPIAVWLHVPRRTETSARGCFLYLSEAVRNALERAGRVPRTTGTITRVGLPETSVLVFGHDCLDACDESRGAARAAGHSAHTSRVSRLRNVVDEEDAILR